MQVIWCFLILLGIKNLCLVNAIVVVLSQSIIKENISTFLLALVQRAIFF